MKNITSQSLLVLYTIYDMNCNLVLRLWISVKKLLILAEVAIRVRSGFCHFFVTFICGHAGVI